MSGLHLRHLEKKAKAEPYRYEHASQANLYNECLVLSDQIPSVKDIVPTQFEAYRVGFRNNILQISTPQKEEKERS